MGAAVEKAAATQGTRTGKEPRHHNSHNTGKNNKTSPRDQWRSEVFAKETGAGSRKGSDTTNQNREITKAPQQSHHRKEQHKTSTALGEDWPVQGVMNVPSWLGKLLQFLLGAMWSLFRRRPNIFGSQLLVRKRGSQSH